MKNKGIPAIIIFAATLFSCKPAEIILHGDITGIVTDAETSQPIQTATVILNTTNDTTSTNTDGSYLFKHLTPGEYEIQASKSSYAVSKQRIVVASAETQLADFSLDGIPVPDPSVTLLDFGLDSTSLRFSISNTGKGNFTYVLTPSKNWITLSPSNGAITNETNNIIIRVNRTGLSESIYRENIKVISFAGQVPLPEITIPVYLNGVGDADGNYYKVVRIGTQVWMAENLNAGVTIPTNTNANNNGIIEKYCYGNSGINCNIYGGLYQWNEAMQYKPSDDGIIGTTQGVCPAGWHIPTNNEWLILADYLGGITVAGGKLKETGLTHWISPNSGATNESSFSALPGGDVLPEIALSDAMGGQGFWWTASEYSSTPDAGHCSVLYNDSEFLSTSANLSKTNGASVRCVKNPGK